MRTAKKSFAHPPGLWQRLMESFRGRRQKLVRGDRSAPLLLLSYPPGSGAEEAALELEACYTHTLPALSDALARRYAPMWEHLPAVVVVLLRPRSACGCLGHHHPRGTESGLARRLQTELGGSTGEIDLAYEAIRRWQPLPLSSLASAELGDRLAQLHFHAALLSVLVHELEHLAFPQKPERIVRSGSNEFYGMLMEELVRAESGAVFGMKESRRES